MQPTNPNQFTEKAWEAIVNTSEVAKKAKQQNLETEHLLQSLLEQDGLATSIFTKAGIDVKKLLNRIEDFINRQPKLAKMDGSVYLGRSLDSLLDRAEDQR
jgi:ATP-dependent Clp protease ATP-binding subunit ClpB